MEKDAVIYVAGARGLVGSNIVEDLSRRGYSNILTAPRQELDLLNQADVNAFFDKNKIDYVFFAAARVGGIYANSTYPADFLYENLMVSANVIHAAARTNVKKLLYLGSSCIYPKFAEQPIEESSLLTGPLEFTNEGYAIAKIAGLKLCEKYQIQYKRRFISVMPTNLYGPGDSFHPENSHVLPGLMRRFHEAKVQGNKEVVMWGTGTPRREFLHVQDLAAAVHMLMEKYEEPTTINVGSGDDLPIAELASMMKEVVGFKGEIVHDTTKPDGTPRKLLDIGKIRKLGWEPKITLRDGLASTYKWAVENNKMV